MIEPSKRRSRSCRSYREQWYGNPKPMPMDESMMAAMEQMMPGMGDMEAMQCRWTRRRWWPPSAGPRIRIVAFIDLTIPHHEMAIRGRAGAATHDEIRTIAERVIQDQQRR